MVQRRLFFLLLLSMVCFSFSIQCALNEGQISLAGFLKQIFADKGSGGRDPNVVVKVILGTDNVAEGTIMQIKQAIEKIEKFEPQIAQHWPSPLEVAARYMVKDPNPASNDREWDNPTSDFIIMVIKKLVASGAQPTLVHVRYCVQSTRCTVELLNILMTPHVVEESRKQPLAESFFKKIEEVHQGGPSSAIVQALKGKLAIEGGTGVVIANESDSDEDTSTAELINRSNAMGKSVAELDEALPETRTQEQESLDVDDQSLKEAVEKYESAETRYEQFITSDAAQAREREAFLKQAGMYYQAITAAYKDVEAEYSALCEQLKRREPGSDLQDIRGLKTLQDKATEEYQSIQNLYRLVSNVHHNLPGLPTGQDSSQGGSGAGARSSSTASKNAALGVKNVALGVGAVIALSGIAYGIKKLLEKKQRDEPKPELLATSVNE